MASVHVGGEDGGQSEAWQHGGGEVPPQVKLQRLHSERERGRGREGQRERARGGRGRESISIMRISRMPTHTRTTITHMARPSLIVWWGGERGEGRGERGKGGRGVTYFKKQDQLLRSNTL